MDLVRQDNFSCTLPWREDNNFTLLMDGDIFFPKILLAVDKAHSAIDIEMYLFESGEISDLFIQALIRAKARGVYIRLVLDDVGSHNLNNTDRQRLKKGGIDLRIFNPLRRKKRFRNLSRDHRKIIIIDDVSCFVGGAGITDSFYPKVTGSRAWRDTMVELNGPVVRDWQLLFERTWLHYDDIHKQEIRDQLKAALSHQESTPLQNRTTPQARVVASRGIGNKPIIASLISEINKSQTRVWLCTAYFYPSRKLIKALIKAAKRDVDVRLLLPGSHTDHPSVRYAGRTWYKKLLRAGVTVYEFQPRFLHMKLALTDQWVSLGSCNFDRWNLRWNLEANLEAIDPTLASACQKMLENDFAESRQFNLTQWLQRPLIERFKERFWKLVGSLLSRIENH